MVNRHRRRRSESGEVAPKKERATIKASRHYSVSGDLLSEDEAEDHIEVGVFAVEPAYISVNHGRTINLGNYESARVDVRVTVPCYAEEVTAAVAFADKTAYAQLESLIAEYVEELK